jgi:hypothetical protein
MKSANFNHTAINMWQLQGAMGYVADIIGYGITADFGKTGPSGNGAAVE